MGRPLLQSEKEQGEGVAYDIPVLRIRDMPENMRPREEMDRVGVKNVSDEVLLSILLGSGIKGRNVVEVARGLLGKYQSLTTIAGLSVTELAGIQGIGEVRAKVLLAALETGRRLTAESLPRRPQVRTPADVANLMREEVRSLDHEVFWALMVDSKNFLKGKPVEVSVGLLDASLAHPREVFREAIVSSAAAMVITHNHPSGDSTPSAEDLRITRQLIEAGKIIGIKVLDHVVMGRQNKESFRDFLSIREEGLVDFA